MLSVATLSTRAQAKRSRELGRMRDYPGGPMIGRGIVRVMSDDCLKGTILISRFRSETELWFYDAKAVLIVKTPVEGPFRGTYVGKTRRRSDGLEMEITIQADFKPIPDSMYLDGHDAFYDITYPEGMMGNPENTRHIYFDGRPFEVPFETMEQGQFSGYDSDVDGEYFVIRDDDVWTTFWAEHKSIMFPTPPKPEIDFGNEMIIVAFHGYYADNGAGIQITSIYNNECFWKVNVMRYTGLGTLPVVINPYHIVKTPYSDLPVNFNVEEVEL